MNKLVFDIGGTFIKYEYELDTMLGALKGVIDLYTDRIEGIAFLLSEMMNRIDANPIYKLPIKVGVCKYFNGSNLIGALYNFQQMYSE